MIRRLGTRLTYSNVMASIAMFVALGGGAYAVTVPRNSVGPGQIRTNAVGATEIKRNAVGASELRAGSVESTDLKNGSVDGTDLKNGSVGSAQLAPGSVGAANLANGSVARSILSFSIGESAANGEVETAPTSVPAGAQFSPYQGLVSTSLVVREAAAREAAALVALVDGQVTVTNTNGNGKPVEVSVRVLHNGEPEPGTFTTTVEDGHSDTIPVSILCDSVRPGDHTFTLEVQAVGEGTLSVGSRSLDAASFRAIFNPPN